MHIIIGVLTAIAGLVWALHSLQNSGVDLNSFNPFTWVRRRKWEKLYGAKPLYNLDKPMEAAAAIVVGVLNQEGIISKEQKQKVVELFMSNFRLDEQDAVALFASSSHLVKDEINLHQSIKNILTPSISKFTPEMKDSFVDLLSSVAKLEGDISESQRKIIASVASVLSVEKDPKSNWG